MERGAEFLGLFFFSSRRRHTRWTGDWSSDVCSSDLIADLNCRDENHRRLLEAGMLADHGGDLESVQFRHANVDQNDGDFVLEEEFERLPAGRGDHEILSKLLQDNFIGQQLGRLIVDQEDVYLVMV